MHMWQSIKRNSVFSVCSIRAPLRSKCLLMTLHQDTLLSFAEVTKSQGTVHVLPDTRIPDASTEDLPSVQVKACCVRLKKTHWATGSPICRSHAEDDTVPSTHLIISDMHAHRIPSGRMCRDGIFSSTIVTSHPKQLGKPVRAVSQLRHSYLANLYFYTAQLRQQFCS